MNQTEPAICPFYITKLKCWFKIPFRLRITDMNARIGVHLRWFLCLLLHPPLQLLEKIWKGSQCLTSSRPFISPYLPYMYYLSHIKHFSLIYCLKKSTIFTTIWWDKYTCMCKQDSHADILVCVHLHPVYKHGVNSIIGSSHSGTNLGWLSRWPTLAEPSQFSITLKSTNLVLVALTSLTR